MKTILLVIVIIMSLLISAQAYAATDFSFPKLLPDFNFNTTGVNTKIPDLPNLLDLDDFKGSDLLDILKAVIKLTVNLFIIILQSLVGILKALLPWLG